MPLAQVLDTIYDCVYKLEQLDNTSFDICINHLESIAEKLTDKICESVLAQLSQGK